MSPPLKRMRTTSPNVDQPALLSGRGQQQHREHQASNDRQEPPVPRTVSLKPKPVARPNSISRYGGSAHTSGRPNAGRAGRERPRSALVRILTFRPEHQLIACKCAPVSMLSKDKIKIGRHDSCDIKINLLDISRKHAVLEWRAAGDDVLDENSPGSWWITDKSLNGIFINQIKLPSNKRTKLEDNDLISFNIHLNEDSAVGMKLNLHFKFALHYDGLADHITVPELEDETNSISDAQTQSNEEPTELVVEEPNDVIIALEEEEDPNPQDFICAICHEFQIEPTMCLPCRHTFCFVCIERWTRTKLLAKCPTCCQSIDSRVEQSDFLTRCGERLLLSEQERADRRVEVAERRRLSQQFRSENEHSITEIRLTTGARARIAYARRMIGSGH